MQFIQIKELIFLKITSCNSKNKRITKFDKASNNKHLNYNRGGYIIFLFTNTFGES